MGNRVEGKAAIVTGGGRGIGNAMAKALAAEGARVAIVDITGDEESAAAEIDGAIAIRADVTSEDDVKRMIDTAVSEFGGLDVLCNNAGIDGEQGPLIETSAEAFDKVIAVNLRGVFLGMRYGIPAMIASGGGSVINTASIAGFVAFPGLGHYCGSKAGVLGLTRVAAIENAPAGVRVNAVCPGVIKTPLLAEMGEDDPLIVAAKAMTPQGRIGEPEEIAAMTVWLASDESSFATGSEFKVDGGYTAL